MADKPKPDYRFKFEIVDETSGEVIESDFCQITDIDQFGGCESIDTHVGQMMRNWRKFARAEYEAKEYPVEEPESEEDSVAQPKV